MEFDNHKLCLILIAVLSGLLLEGSCRSVDFLPFFYIAIIDSMNKMCVDELNDGEVKNLKLTRVLQKTIEELK